MPPRPPPDPNQNQIVIRGRIHEFVTTTAKIPSDPVTPRGVGWVMTGSAANSKSLFWFWARPA